MTVVARGRRLETLEREGGIESVTGERATFKLQARSTRKARGMPSLVELDMESFLRTHAAFVIPLMASGGVVYEPGAKRARARPRSR